MSMRDIIWAPDRVLKTNCTPVTEIDGDIRQILEDMLETMYAAHGIGLAAPQNGLDKRLHVVDISRDERGNRQIKVIHPEIEWVSAELTTTEEGGPPIHGNP